MAKMKKIVFLIIVCVVIMSGILCYNYFQLQYPVNAVLRNDIRNRGIEVSVHLGNYVNPSVLIYNLKSISGENSMIDVFRVLLQSAKALSSKQFKTVHLAFRNKTKFKLDGAYFQKIGKEYSWQNPLYTMRTFPEHLKNPDGSQAYGRWIGGWLGVIKKQMEDFKDFHKKWYLEDMIE